MKNLILSVDIGTSSLKAALIDFDGRLHAFSRLPCTIGSKASVWETAFSRALKDLMEQMDQAGGNSPGNLSIECICVSGNGPTLVPVNRKGKDMQPIYWFGARCPWDKEIPSFFLPYIVCYRKKKPFKYHKTSVFFSSHEWLSHRLGAEPFTALPNDAYESFYWDEEQCRLLGLDIKKFPPFVKTGSIAGKLSEEAARRFPGLKGGTPIIAGGPDFFTALIGTGTFKSGDVCDRAGTSEGINVCAAGQLNENGLNLSGLNASGLSESGIKVLPHIIEGLFNVGSMVRSSGYVFEHYRKITGQENRPYEELLLDLIPPESGIKAFEDELHFPNEMIALGRAVLCRIAYAVRTTLNTLKEAGFPVKTMTASGGQGKNRLWNQLKADITGVTLVIPEIRDGELAGNAVLCAAALASPGGSCSSGDILSAAARMIRSAESYEPRAETASFWDGQYDEYIHINHDKTSIPPK